MFDVVVIDGINVDLCFGVDHLPEPDEKVRARFFGSNAGGPAANFACVASKLGLKVSANCVIGNDDFGKVIIDSFKEFRVDLSNLSIDPKLKTPITVVLLNEKTGERSIIIPEIETSSSLKSLEKNIRDARYIYTLPKENYKDQIKILDIAYASNTKTMIDFEPTFSYSNEELVNILRKIQIASFNQRGFRKAFNQDFSDDLAHRVFEDYKDLILIVTLGADGAFCISDQGAFHCPALNNHPIDTTGAGDAFNAGFLTALLDGRTHEICLTWGSASSASLISTLGARSELKNKNQLEKFILKVRKEKR